MSPSRALVRAFAALALLAGCAGGPSPVSGQTPPDWVVNRPADDANYFYFVGSGTSPAGDLAEARAAATGEILSEIMRHLGVTVTAESTATARGSLADFQASVEQVVRQSGEARVAGLDIRDTWIDRRRRPAVTVHVLARYQRSELLKEKQRLEALFRERIESVEGPEREGDRLLGQGRPYEAAIQYMSAAAAALRPDVDNGPVKFKRNLDKAKAAVERINLVKLNDNLKARAGQPIPEPFRLKVASGGNAADPGVPDAMVLFTYQETNPTTGRPRPKSERAKTDATGVVEFGHPTPDFVGEASVTAALDLAAYADPLLAAPRELRSEVDTLLALVAGRRATFRLTVESGAGTVPMGVLLVDYDQTGKLLGTTESAGSVQAALSGYNVRPLSFPSSDIAGRTASELAALVKARYGGELQRAVIGQVRITELGPRSGRIFAKAVADVQVVDLAEGTVLYSGSREKLGMGASDQEAVSRALRDLGRDLGVDIKNRLK